MASEKSSHARKRKLPSWMTEKATKNNQGDGNASKNDNFPDLKFTEKTVYSFNKDECSLLCQDILDSVGESGLVVGFDIEWPVTYQKGKEDKTALLQLCTSCKECYLFHLSCMSGFPKGLKRLLLSDSVKKVGIGIESDLWKLERDFDFQVKPIIKTSMIDLSVMANKVLKSSENWSLDNLCRHMLGQKLFKDPSVRKSDWRAYPLTHEQKLYAATDAYAGLLAYKELLKKKQATAEKDSTTPLHLIVE